MPFLNGVLREDPHGDAAGLLGRARDFFFGLGRGFVVFTWPGDPELLASAEQAGMFTIMERYPEMVCQTRLAGRAGNVEPVVDLLGAAEYWSTCDAAYPSLGFPPGLFAASFRPEDLVQRDELRACIAREDGRPVACALVCVPEDVGFVGWVASIPEVRGRGYAAECTVWATNQAFEMGADTASLQASPMGEELYRRLGYEELFSYRLLGAMPPAA
jgi:ribosomal protein S18 acetylase RimI-like enzyme